MNKFLSLKKNQKYIFIFFILFLLTFLIYFNNTGFLIKAESIKKVIRVGVYQNEPKIFVNSKGEVDGIWADIIEEIAKINNWQIEYIIGDWKSCLDNLINNKIDIMPDVAYSDERAKIYDFNEIPVLSSFSRIYINKKVTIKKLSDLNNKKISVLSSSIQEKNLILLRQNLFFTFEIISVNSLENGFNFTKQGITDCIITNNFFGDYFYKEYGLKRTEIELFPADLFFATKKSENLDILPIIDEIVLNWKKTKNSVYYKILNRWKISPKTKSENLLNLSILIASLLIIFMVFYVLFIRANIKRIKERMRLAFDSLSLSEKYFAEYSEISPVGIFRTDQKGNIIFVNKAWKQITDYENNDCLGENFFNNIESSERQNIKDEWKKTLLGEKEFDKTVTIIDIKGESHWLKIKTKKLLDNDGNLTGYIGVFDDITEEKILNEKLNKALDDINLLFEFSSLLNINLLNPNFTYDILKKIIEFFNLDAAILFQVKDGRLFAKDIQPEKIQKLWNPSQIHQVGECICGKAYEQGIPCYLDDLEIEKLASREECKIVGFKSIAVIPLKYGNQKIGLLFLAKLNQTDFSKYKNLIESISFQISVALNNILMHSKLITYSKELEAKVYERTKELEIALEKAQFADKMKSAFLATMSHELRTPLNSIIGFTGILLQELPGKLNEEQRKQLSIVKKSSEHLLELINDVLDLSKIEAGEFKLSYEIFNVFPFIEDIINTVIPLVQKKGLEFDFYIDKRIQNINCDKRRLKQIIINLLSNAIKFTEKGKISLNIEKNDDMISFSITDTGIGIKDEDKNLLFKPFSQINQGLNRAYEGTGLGLSICKKMIELFNGKIEVESEFGIGSKFSFTIPEK